MILITGGCAPYGARDCGSTVLQELQDLLGDVQRLPAGRAVCCGGSPHWQAAFAALASLSLSQRGTVRLWGCPAGQSKVRQVTVLA